MTGSLLAKRRFVQRFSLLLHPVYVLCLFLLLLNDHYLKESFPSFITGKLSDVTGLFVFAVFLYVIFGRYFISRVHIALLCSSVAILFTIWKIGPVEKLTALIAPHVAFPLPSRVADITDLYMLPSLAAAYVFIIYAPTPLVTFRSAPLWRRLSFLTVICCSTFAIVATTLLPKKYQVTSEQRLDSSASAASVLYAVERTMSDNDFDIFDRIETSPDSFRISFHWSDPILATPMDSGYSTVRSIGGDFLVYRSSAEDSWQFGCDCESQDRDFTNQQVLEALEMKLIDPVVEELRLRDE